MLLCEDWLDATVLQPFVTVSATEHFLLFTKKQLLPCRTHNLLGGIKAADCLKLGHGNVVGQVHLSACVEGCWRHCGMANGFLWLVTRFIRQELPLAPH